MAISYKNAGVDIKKADEFVDSIGGMVYKDKLARLGAFASLFDAGFMKKFKHPVMVSATDGVGTKLLLAQELGVHDTVGVDLVAMNVNDLICVGARPLFFLDYLGCGKVKPAVLKSVVKGIHDGLTQSDCALIGGETAEMPGMYDENEYDLAGFAVGAVDKDKIVDGRNMKAGDLVVGLSSSGVHSNGYSLVRKLFIGKDRKKYAKMLLEPTRIYVKPVMALLDNALGISVKAIAHNTGGGFYNKITKVLPAGLGFKIDKDTWTEPEVFSMIRERSGLKEKELYTTFNMGIGMIVVVKKEAADKVTSFFCRKGFPATIIGEVVKSGKKMELV
jgi:phosphoribosylformylglycinamidine cyclo-ligase